MRTALTICFATFAFTISTRADFVGLTTVYAGTCGGKDIYTVLSCWDEADDVLLNYFDHQTTVGNQNGVWHNDFAGGNWNPNFTFLPDQGACDTYVTMNGQFGASSSTALDPSFGSGMGTTIPHNAGWYTSNPGVPIVVGTAGTATGGLWKTKLMQVALQPGDPGWCATLIVGWKDTTSTTTAMFSVGFYCVPAPGALALFGLSGCLSRRRRS